MMSRRQGDTSKRLARNTAALSLTQVTRIAVNTLLTLLVARRLGVEGLGKYAVLTAYLQIFQVLAKMGVHRLVVREMAREPDQGRDWFQLIVVNQVLGAGLSAALLILVVNLLNHPPDTTQALKITALSLFPFAISAAAESAFQAKERMGFTALAQITARVVQVIGSLLALHAGHGIVALAWMIVGTQCLAAVIESGVTKQMGLWVGFRVDLRRVVLLFRQSFDFLIISLSVIVFLRLDTLILSQVVGEKAVGLYSAAYLIVRIINFLSSSYSEAIYPVLSRLFITGRARFKALLYHSLLLGVTITLLIAILLASAAEPIIDLLYQGQEYAASVPLLRIVSALIVVLMWNALLSKGLIASNLQRRSVIVASVKLGVALVCYPVLTAWLGLRGIALATVLAAFSGTLLNLYFINKQVCSLDLVTLAVKPFVVGAVLSIALWAARSLAWPLLMIGGTLFYVSLLFAFRMLSPKDTRLFRQMVWPL